MFDKVILGTVQLGIPYGINNSTGKPELNEALRILSVAMSNGIRVLDTADAYGDAQEIIGEYHKTSNEKFDVITKFSSSGSSLSLEQKVLNSLQTLRVDYLYGYLFHNPSDFFKSPQILRELGSVKRQGLIKHVGISIYSNQDFSAAIDTEEVDLIQIPYNLLDNRNQRGDLIEKAKEKGKIIHTRSAFLQGLFFKTIDQLPVKLKPLSESLEAIFKVSEKAKVGIQELAISYVLNNSSIDGIILGVDTLDQLNENIEVLKKIALGRNSYNSKIDEVNVKEVELLNPNNWK